ncbi:hypothetical protein JMJ77_0001005 [Colletotrichum scovillei]|uniref:Uncharacterized protein n=1 Tax=Colletotrichum scovillei TaxID=1209932 RepID=A0A9P7RE17_9PEZI|nr:hypothetical protein JMJ77_0001005 [Colletotrichum scovillei]KAG7072224.1 hypothetical protein JMJ76_0005080 [Colletotrichum scovillei]KAG7080336.1 hypothetical protein JMJ78_0007432 [Colletotrichum scovillei]
MVSSEYLRSWNLYRGCGAKKHMSRDDERRAFAFVDGLDDIVWTLVRLILGNVWPGGVQILAISNNGSLSVTGGPRYFQETHGTAQWWASPMQ